MAAARAASSNCNTYSIDYRLAPQNPSPAANARRDGVDTTLTVYPDTVHGWMILSKLPATIQASDEIDHWISETLGVSR